MAEPLVMAATSDVAGQLRGKGFALADLDRRRRSGVGWTPTNVQITCFDGIAPSPYGSTGDMVLWPDETLYEAPVGDGPPLRLVLGDVRDADGAPWEACLRGHLRAAIAGFEAASDLTIMASFEHEFTLTGLDAGPAFSASGFHRAQGFAEALLTSLQSAGLEPDSFLREFGPGQFEVTLAPKPAMQAADEAIILREITRAVARSHGLKATFSPISDPESVGNGVHVHLSYWTRDGTPRTHDPDHPVGLTPIAGHAAAGILRHMPALSALTAPTAISFIRLQPHRWSAAFANLAIQDREAGLRICPTSARDATGKARQFNYEYRAADAAASPWLTLSGLIFAATAGVRDGLPCPEPTKGDLSELSAEALQSMGIEPLPRTPTEALLALENDRSFTAHYPQRFVAIYLAHKRFEFEAEASTSQTDLMKRYAEVY